MSSSATIGGSLVLSPRYLRSMKAPPAFMLARSVRRMSMMWPCRSGVRRRVFTSSSDSTMRLIAMRAAAISSAVICAKSFFCSSSRSDTVKLKSSSTSRSSGLSFCASENSASCTRVAAGGGGRRRRQHHRHQVVEKTALAEEDAERLLEDDRVLVPLHEHGVQRPVEVVLGADARRLHRRERVEHRARADREPSHAQRAGE